jgi:hypothetical protein
VPQQFSRQNAAAVLQCAVQPQLLSNASCFLFSILFCSACRLFHFQVVSYVPLSEIFVFLLLLHLASFWPDTPCILHWMLWLLSTISMSTVTVLADPPDVEWHLSLVSLQLLFHQSSYCVHWLKLSCLQKSFFQHPNYHERRPDKLSLLYQQ